MNGEPAIVSVPTIVVDGRSGDRDATGSPEVAAEPPSPAQNSGNGDSGKTAGDKAAQEQAKKDKKAAEQAKKDADEQAKKDKKAAEQAKKDADEQAKKDKKAAEQAKKDADEQAKEDAGRLRRVISTSHRGWEELREGA